MNDPITGKVYHLIDQMIGLIPLHDGKMKITTSLNQLCDALAQLSDGKNV
jgi:hypothetical protein